MLKMIQIFPTVLICLNLLAAMMALFEHDYRRAIYWFAAAVLNATVTF
jgi:hypothetical protein